MSDNRFENYGVGVYVERGDPYRIDNNVFRRCGIAIKVAGGWEVEVLNNDIRECGVGIDASDVDELTLRGNKVFGVTGSGVIARAVGGMLAETNVVGRCGGAGFALDSPSEAGSLPYPLGALLVNNTVFDNGGSGIELTRAPWFPVYPIAVKRNASIANGAWGLVVPAGESIELGCNDWFGNGLGAVTGAASGATDISIDALFCGVADADVRLDSASPLLGSGCGQIGALGVGCASAAKSRAKPRPRFGLAEVTPNPGNGPVRMAFWLEQAGTIEIDVFDLLGRRVASPARGTWPAGTHEVEWNGLVRNGQPAPSGVYLVRYAHAGGQDRRSIVRLP